MLILQACDQPMHPHVPSLFLSYVQDMSSRVALTMWHYSLTDVFQHHVGNMSLIMCQCSLTFHVCPRASCNKCAGLSLCASALSLSKVVQEHAASKLTGLSLCASVLSLPIYVQEKSASTLVGLPLCSSALSLLVFVKNICTDTMVLQMCN